MIDGPRKRRQARGLSGRPPRAYVAGPPIRRATLPPATWVRKSALRNGGKAEVLGGSIPLRSGRRKGSREQGRAAEGIEGAKTGEGVIRTATTGVRRGPPRWAGHATSRHVGAEVSFAETASKLRSSGDQSPCGRGGGSYRGLETSTVPSQDSAAESRPANPYARSPVPPIAGVAKPRWSCLFDTEPPRRFSRPIGKRKWTSAGEDAARS